MTDPVTSYAERVVAGEIPGGRMATIYALCDSRDPDPIKRVRYVGQTLRTPERRMRGHWQRADAGEPWHRARWMRAVKAGGGMVVLEVLAQVPASEADSTEISYIAEYRGLGCDLTNRNNGGRGGPPVVSEETRRKQSLSASRRKASPETRRKMSEAIKASHRRPETVAKLRAAQLGRVRSQKTRERMSRGLRGEVNGQSVLTWQAVAEIRARHSCGACQAQLAQEFRCSRPTIHRVVHLNGWIPA